MIKILVILVTIFFQFGLVAQYLLETSFERDTANGYIPRSSPWKPISGTYIAPNVLTCHPYPVVDGSKCLGVYVGDQASMYIHQKFSQKLIVGKEYEVGLYIRNADTSRSNETDSACNRALGATYLEVYVSQNNQNTAVYIQKDSSRFENKRRLWRSPKVDFLEWRHFKFTFIADSAYQYFFIYNTPNQKYYPYNIDYITFRATDEPEPDPPIPTGVDDVLLNRRKVVLRFGK